jgi:hypothetical protein
MSKWGSSHRGKDHPAGAVADSLISNPDTVAGIDVRDREADA